MLSQLKNNNLTLQSLLEILNMLPSISVSSVNDKTGKVVLTAKDIDGTFAGIVIADEYSQSPEISLLRNSKLVANEEIPNCNGEIYWVYE